MLTEEHIKGSAGIHAWSMCKSYIAGVHGLCIVLATSAAGWLDTWQQRANSILTATIAEGQALCMCSPDGKPGGCYESEGHRLQHAVLCAASHRESRDDAAPPV